MSAGRLALWPAIDLCEGRVVRLLQGELDQTTVYDGDPAEVARRFAAEGADGLHVVDLDAAFGRGQNRAKILEIVETAGIPVQVGGGFRTEKAVEEFLEGKGADRLVLGSLPFLERALFLHLLGRFSPSRFVVALDCRDGRPTTSGWTKDAAAGDAVSVARELFALGVGSLLVTDVARDGAMTGPNLELLSSVRAVFPGEILASGGLRGEEDLVPVDAALSGGARGAIFGRALHAGATTVARLAAARGAPAAAGREG
ncbi:MAG TPA: 1-(5-phosphoribosyl)-5-[(5-phosphoribosylamino)methylideneamino] imidazole-4-carboxamide isomerase [Thermoanaerobaculia bacterium]|nr:1-(5-phosphoribosyl)-5-[(5-phosphoribosylamino)methylideneamino] imidazole-4-carboxamide isomerase [Thermoanaerobaculia bacterium]